MKLPVLFTGHGSPMIALEDNKLTENFRKVGEYILENFEKPKGILAISAHWFLDDTFVQSEENPKQIYDMYGFPKELYEVKYEAKGYPELGKKVSKILNIDINNDWGIDHGTWTVLKHMFPSCDIPVVQLSINYNLKPEEAFEIGKKLKSFRDEGVLLFGTGNVVHNLRKVDWHNPKGTKDADKFDEYIKDSILNKKFENVINYKDFPNYENSVPTFDHFYPLLYCLGAVDEDDEIVVFNNIRMMGTMSMTSYFFN